MEFTCNNSLPEVTHFWQQLVDRIIELPSKKGMVRERGEGGEKGVRESGERGQAGGDD